MVHGALIVFQEEIANVIKSGALLRTGAESDGWCMGRRGHGMHMGTVDLTNKNSFPDQGT